MVLVVRLVMGLSLRKVGKERFCFYVVIVEMVVKHIEVLQLFSFFWSTFFCCEWGCSFYPAFSGWHILVFILMQIVPFGENKMANKWPICGQGRMHPPSIFLWL